MYVSMPARKSFLRSILLALLGMHFAASRALPNGTSEWRAQAARVTISRDDWGIAHVHGHSDADAIFGMMYAQAEDDFSRVENNYLVSLGRESEAEGAGALWRDLRQQLFVDVQQLQSEYSGCPSWLKQLLQAWAAGLNYFLATHPQVHPRVLTHFEPWMALSFSEGSIGGDIERASLKSLEDFYGAPSATKQGRIDTHNAVVAQLAQVNRD